MFIGREKELERLASFYSSDFFDIAVIYGRRRIGKSFLLRNFSQDKRTIFFQATTDKKNNLDELGALVSFVYGTTNPILYHDYAEVFSEIGNLAKTDKLLFIIDELSFLTESDKSVLSVLQKFCDNPFQDTKLKLILCSSYSSFMEERVISGSSPLFGRTTLRLKLQGITTEESSAFFPKWELKEIAMAHVISGGVPYYLKRISRYESFDEAVHEEFFSMGGALLNEPILLLYTWARNTNIYFNMISAIASGIMNTAKIASKLNIEPAQASAMLKTLTSYDIVAKKENAVIGGRKATWRIKDNFFAFWASFVFPAMANIEIDNSDAAFKIAIENLPQFTGKHIEEDIRKYIIRHSDRLIMEYGSAEFPNPQEKTNEELDFIAKCENEIYLFGKFKWRNRETGIHVLDDLKRKSILAVSRNVKREYYICSESGFSDELIELASKDKTIHLIEGDELFGIAKHRISC